MFHSNVLLICGIIEDRLRQGLATQAQIMEFVGQHLPDYEQNEEVWRERVKLMLGVMTYCGKVARDNGDSRTSFRYYLTQQ